MPEDKNIPQVNNNKGAVNPALHNDNDFVNVYNFGAGLLDKLSHKKIEELKQSANTIDDDKKRDEEFRKIDFMYSLENGVNEYIKENLGYSEKDVYAYIQGATELLSRGLKYGDPSEKGRLAYYEDFKNRISKIKDLYPGTEVEISDDGINVINPKFNELRSEYVDKNIKSLAEQHGLLLTPDGALKRIPGFWKTVPSQLLSGALNVVNSFIKVMEESYKNLPVEAQNMPLGSGGIPSLPTQGVIELRKRSIENDELLRKAIEEGEITEDEVAYGTITQGEINKAKAEVLNKNPKLKDDYIKRYYPDYYDVLKDKEIPPSFFNLSSMLTAKSNKISEETKQSNYGFIENIKEGNISAAFKQAAGGVFNSLPYVVAMSVASASGGTSGLLGSTFVLGSTDAFASKEFEKMLEGKDVSGEDYLYAFISGVGSAATNWALESVAPKTGGKVIKNILGQESKEAAFDVVKKSVQSQFAKTFMGFLEGALSEATQEFLENLSQMVAANVIYGDDIDVDGLALASFSAYFTGGAFGSMASLPTATKKVLYDKVKTNLNSIGFDLKDYKKFTNNNIADLVVTKSTAELLREKLNGNTISISKENIDNNDLVGDFVNKVIERYKDNSDIVKESGDRYIINLDNVISHTDSDLNTFRLNIELGKTESDTEISTNQTSELRESSNEESINKTLETPIESSGIESVENIDESSTPETSEQSTIEPTNVEGGDVGVDVTKDTGSESNIDNVNKQESEVTSQQELNKENEIKNIEEISQEPVSEPVVSDNVEIIETERVDETNKNIKEREALSDKIFENPLKKEDAVAKIKSISNLESIKPDEVTTLLDKVSADDKKMIRSRINKTLVDIVKEKGKDIKSIYGLKKELINRLSGNKTTEDARLLLETSGYDIVSELNEIKNGLSLSREFSVDLNNEVRWRKKYLTLKTKWDSLTDKSKDAAKFVSEQLSDWIKDYKRFSPKISNEKIKGVADALASGNKNKLYKALNGIHKEIIKHRDKSIKSIKSEVRNKTKSFGGVAPYIKSFLNINPNLLDDVSANKYYDILERIAGRKLNNSRIAKGQMSDAVVDIINFLGDIDSVITEEYDAIKEDIDSLTIDDFSGDKAKIKELKDKIKERINDMNQEEAALIIDFFELVDDDFFKNYKINAKGGTAPESLLSKWKDGAKALVGINWKNKNVYDLTIKARGYRRAKSLHKIFEHAALENAKLPAGKRKQFKRLTDIIRGKGLFKRPIPNYKIDEFIKKLIKSETSFKWEYDIYENMLRVLSVADAKSSQVESILKELADISEEIAIESKKSYANGVPLVCDIIMKLVAIDRQFESNNLTWLKNSERVINDVVNKQGNYDTEEKEIIQKIYDDLPKKSITINDKNGKSHTFTIIDWENVISGKATKDGKPFFTDAMRRFIDKADEVFTTDTPYKVQFVNSYIYGDNVRMYKNYVPFVTVSRKELNTDSQFENFSDFAKGTAEIDRRNKASFDRTVNDEPINLSYINDVSTTIVDIYRDYHLTPAVAEFYESVRQLNRNNPFEKKETQIETSPEVDIEPTNEMLFDGITPKIDKAKMFAEAVADVIEGNENDIKELGHGANGIAFSMGDKVLKVTSDKMEVYAAQKINEAKESPTHLIKTEKVFKVNDLDNKESAYVLVNEKIDSELHKDKKKEIVNTIERTVESIGDEEADSVAYFFSKISKEVKKAVRNNTPFDYEGWKTKINELRDKLPEGISKEDADITFKFLNDFIEIAKELTGNGIGSADFDWNNIGYRADGTWVYMDIGSIFAEGININDSSIEKININKENDNEQDIDRIAKGYYYDMVSGVEHMYTTILKSIYVNNRFTNFDTAGVMVRKILLLSGQLMLVKFRKLISESLSNIVGWATYSPNSIKNIGYIKHKDNILNLMKFVGSTHFQRFSDLASNIQLSILTQQLSRSKFNKFAKSEFLTIGAGSKLSKYVEKLNESVIRSADAFVSIPFWFSKFNEKFKELTGKDIDIENYTPDSGLLLENIDAVRKASAYADLHTNILVAPSSKMETIFGISTAKPTSIWDTMQNMFRNFNANESSNMITAIRSLTSKEGYLLDKSDATKLLVSTIGKQLIYQYFASSLLLLTQYGVESLLGNELRKEEIRKMMLDQFTIKGLMSNALSSLFGVWVGAYTFSERMLATYVVENIIKRLANVSLPVDRYIDNIAFGEIKNPSNISNYYKYMGYGRFPIETLVSLVTVVNELFKDEDKRKDLWQEMYNLMLFTAMLSWKVPLPGDIDLITREVIRGNKPIFKIYNTIYKEVKRNPDATAIKHIEQLQKVLKDDFKKNKPLIYKTIVYVKLKESRPEVYENFPFRLLQTSSISVEDRGRELFNHLKGLIDDNTVKPDEVYNILQEFRSNIQEVFGSDTKITFIPESVIDEAEAMFMEYFQKLKKKDSY